MSAAAVPSLSVVAAGALVADGRVFLAKRPPDKPLPLLWEFPGGKLEAGETPEAALARELAEEIRVEVAAADMAPLTFATTFAGPRPLLLLLYLVRRWEGEPRAIEAPEAGWFTLSEARALAMPPADAPFLPALAPHLGC